MTPSTSDSRGRRSRGGDRQRADSVEDALQQLISDRQRDDDQAELRDRLDQLYREVKGDEDTDDPDDVEEDSEYEG
ncbi:MAG TPA: hypothetical protein IAA98_13970 [Candidatus Avipropionibacterium avicola]|uniref:Uncharacterized protein n=1 Tax=Candidatus Avipropionibacterium avicola TaxID=2840701 RepID=A0A9D1H1H5_9ACTN|nr:hypothetical protein [Candidatus Avipropionibacterium avicola]